MYPVIGMVGGWPAVQSRYQFEVGLVGWMSRPDVVGAGVWEEFNLSVSSRLA